MNLNEFIRTCSDDDLAIFFVLVIITTLQTQGLDISKVDLQSEKIAFKQLLSEPMSEALRESMLTLKDSEKPLS